MDFSGRYVIAAPPEAVWAALNDPVILKACIPGCQQIEKSSPTDFVATATLKIGPVKATFKGKVTLSDLDPPSRCTISGEGQGGMAGFAKGNADVRLQPEGDATVLTYTARATVGGKLAQIGQRLIDGAARQIADDFFGRFAAYLEPAMVAQPLPSEAPPATTPNAQIDQPAGASAEQASRRSGLGSEIWVIGLIGVVVILLLLFGVAL
jgi:carbon monoxide dehydrogenase subunit G